MWKKQQTSSGVVLLDVLHGAVLIVAADVNDLTLGLDRLGLHLGGFLGGLLLGLLLGLGLHLGLDLLPGLLRPDSLEGTLHPVKCRMADELGVLPVAPGRLTLNLLNPRQAINIPRTRPACPVSRDEQARQHTATVRKEGEKGAADGQSNDRDQRGGKTGERRY